MLDSRGPGGRLLQHISQAAAEDFIISSAPGTPVSPRGLVRTAYPGGAGSLLGSVDSSLSGGGGGRQEEPALCATRGGGVGGGGASAVAAGGGGRGEKRKDAPCGERKKSGSRRSSGTGSCSAPCLPHSGRRS